MGRRQDPVQPFPGPVDVDGVALLLAGRGDVVDEPLDLLEPGVVR
jgi:hypothetical protein